MKTSKLILILSFLTFSFTFYGCSKDNKIEINAPTDLSAFSRASNQIELNWTDNSDNETGFEVSRSTDTINGYSIISTVDPNVATFSDNTIDNGTIYYYRVRAICNNDYSSYSLCDFAESEFTISGTWSGLNCDGSDVTLAVSAQNELNSFSTYLEISGAPCDVEFYYDGSLTIVNNKTSFAISSSNTNIKASVTCTFKTYDCCKILITETNSGSAYVCSSSNAMGGSWHLSIDNPCVSLISKG